MGLDPLYWLFALPGLVIGMLASLYVQFTFDKYSRIMASSGYTGARAARELLDAHGLRHVRVEISHGFLSDHYDPTSRTLRLSPAVFNSRSLAAIGVACHEAGHALQHAAAFAPLQIRSTLVPVTQFGTQLSYLLFLVGLLFRFTLLMQVGALFFGAAVLFTLITLPVEWDASARARRLMVSAGIVTPQERDAAAVVLRAAFLTYVAAVVTAILQFLYFLIRSGLLGGGRRR